MNPQARTGDDDRYPLMDELLRHGVPEIKLALGAVIDRENAHPLPVRYARLMPESVLQVTLRADAAEALAPVARDLERELTDSCSRHGSLYDRSYRVRLGRSEDPDAPVYTISAHAGAAAAAAPGAGSPSVEAADQDRPAGGPSAAMPLADPEATRPAPALPGWEAGRWLLIVEDDSGDEREVFRLSEPRVTVGRTSDDPHLRAAIAISDAPHVSRRQLALTWEERDGAPGFALYNLGLNDIHVPGQTLPGSRAGKGSLELDSVPEESIGWLPPGVPLRIGDGGPTLRVEEVPREAAGTDPDATVFE